jgi:pyruvate dehydrogenase E2 component (dihydrolipoamide acetyltransferase)
MPDAAAGRPASGPSEQPETDTRPLSSIRRVVARLMASAWSTVPAVTLYRTVPFAPLLAARERLTDVGGRKPAVDALLAILVGRTLVEFELLNGSYLEQKQAVLVHAHRNVAVAVDTSYGLTAVVLRDADQLLPMDADRQLVTMVERARAGRTLLRDLAEATFTITNLGSLGVEAFSPIITLPQAAVLGIGAISSSPLSERPTTLSLTFDHRVVDGADAARFLAGLARRIGEDAPWA